jgi:adenosylcobinamide-phosphate synthase
MMVFPAPVLAFVALVIEASAGYPHLLYQRITHPVTWIGALIGFLERNGNRTSWSFGLRRIAGVGALLVVLVVTGSLSLAVTVLAMTVLPVSVATFVLAVIASSLLAQRSLDDHVTAVADALEMSGLDAGRRAVGMIVGRDTAVLDQAGVSRAAIESLAENFADGVVAPLFWLLCGGLPGAALYKAINTADSMIGHRSERYLAFGWASARLDDLVNLPASRLAALWLTLAAFVVPGGAPREALGAVWRDSGHHKSPNAGWPEAAMAGALGMRLAGPRMYGGKLVDDHWMGNGRADLSATDIRRALLLYRTACTLQAVVVGGLALGIAVPILLATASG